MANTLDDGGFCLPSEFLSDDDILMDKENINKYGLNARFGANMCFPTEFPYEFGYFGSSSALSSPVESVGGSATETESDEEDLLTGLTRQLVRSTLNETRKMSCVSQNLEKTWVLSGSPQSTLTAVGSWSDRSTISGNGSPNGPSQVSSPPTTPLGGNIPPWDLIYAAAGQVARLKVNGDGPINGRGLLGHPRSLPPAHHSLPVKNPNTGFYSSHCPSHTLSENNLFQHVRQDQVLKQQSFSVWGRNAREEWLSQQQVPQNRGSRVGINIGGGLVQNGGCGRPLGSPQSAWPPLQVQHQNQPQQSGSGMRAAVLGGSGGGGKRECAGTGVFLPRRYSNPSEPRKKPGYSTGLLPARVIQTLNKNFDDITAQVKPQAQPCCNGAFNPDHDWLIARRNVLLTQQKWSIRPEGAMNQEIRLPQEWTY